MSHVRIFKEVLNDGIRQLMRPPPHIQLIDVFMYLSHMFDENGYIHVHVTIGDQLSDYDVVVIYTDSPDASRVLTTYIADVVSIVLKGRVRITTYDDHETRGCMAHIEYLDERIMVVLVT